MKDVRDAFFGFLEPPRISSEGVLRKAVTRGVAEGQFGYTTGSPTLGTDGKYQVALTKLSFGRSMSEDEVDLDGGFLIAPAAVPTAAPPPPPLGGGTGSSTITTGTSGDSTTSSGGGQTGGGATGGGGGDATGGSGGSGGPKVRTGIRIAFPATREQVFKSFQAIANLADKSDGGKISIVIQGQAATGYDPNWLRNAVEEPLNEANIEGMQIE